MKRIPIKAANVHIEMDFHLAGSVLRGTVSSGVSEVRSHFDIVSEASKSEILATVLLSKQGCFAEKLVESSVPLSSKLTINNEIVNLEEHS